MCRGGNIGLMKNKYSSGRIVDATMSSSVNFCYVRVLSKKKLDLFFNTFVEKGHPYGVCLEPLSPYYYFEEYNIVKASREK